MKIYKIAGRVTIFRVIRVLLDGREKNLVAIFDPNEVTHGSDRLIPSVSSIVPKTIETVAHISIYTISFFQHNVMS